MRQMSSLGPFRGSIFSEGAPPRGEGGLLFITCHECRKDMGSITCLFEHRSMELLLP